MIKTSHILFITLLGLSLSKISVVAPLAKGSLLSGDYFYSDLTNNLDFKDAKYPITINGKNAIANNQTDSYMDKHFQVYDFTTLNWVKKLNNDSVIYCFDNKNLILQYLDGEGKAFGTYDKIAFPAADIKCTDAVHYRHREFVYVGCVTRKTTSTNPGSVYVLTWNLQTKNITHVEITKQDDDFQIRNRLQLFMTSIETSEVNDQTDFLLLYDQGNTNSVRHRGNDNMRIYRNVEFGNLKFFKLLAVEAVDYKIVYDFFPYDHTVIVSGRVEGPTETIITLTQCTIQTKEAVLKCNGNQHKGTTITKGKVGIDLMGNYFQIDLNKKTLTLAKLSGPFSSSDWNRNVIREIKDLDVFDDLEHAYVRFYSGTGEVGVINYGTLTGVDHGYTGVSFVSNISWKKEGVAACNIGRSVVFGNVDQTVGHTDDVVSLMRPLEPYLLIPSSKLNPGKNIVNVEASDSDSPSPASLSTIFTKVETIFDGDVKVKDMFGDIIIEGGKSTFVSVPETAVQQGNALSVKITSEGGAVRGIGASGVAVKIKWVPDHDHGDVEHFAFDGRKALVQTVTGKVYFYNCDRVSLERHTCHQFASYPLPEPAQPFRDFLDYKDTTFTWTCDSKECYALIVQDDGDLSKVTLSHSTKSVFYSHDPHDELSMRLYATDGNTVKIWTGPRHEPEALVLWYEITEENAGQDWFCPSQVTHCPDSADVLEVLNNCDGSNQKVLKFNIAGFKPDFYESANLDGLLPNPFFCPMGSEFIFGSTHSFSDNAVYSTSTHDDLSYYSIPKELVGHNWRYSCIQRDRRFVMYKYENGGTVQATVMVGNRGHSQLTRYPVIIPSLKVSNAHAFPSFDGIMHWFDVQGEHLFFVTFTTPKLDLTAQAVEKETKVDVEIEFSNGKNSMVMKKEITVTP